MKSYGDFSRDQPDNARFPRGVPASVGRHKRGRLRASRALLRQAPQLFAWRLPRLGIGKAGGRLKRETKKALRYGGWAFSHVIFTILKVIGTVLLVFLTTGAILAGLTTIYVTQDMEVDLDVSLSEISLDQASFVYYTDKTTGEEIELDTFYDKENRVWASYKELPKTLINALIAIEDKRFYTHQGVDWKRTLGAFGQMFGGGSRTYGGSTITQQLIKNVTGEKEVTIKRKINEIMRALEFEKKYSKEQILEWYLNTCYFGQGCYGVKTAAQTYFGKELSQLTLAEAASIIGITNSPTKYNPFINPDHNKERQETILKEMYEQEMISESVWKQAKAETLRFTKENRPSEKSDRTFFVDQVFDDVVKALMEEKGVTKQVAQTLVFSGGLKIYTTIDPEIQAIIDDVFIDNENFPTVKDTGKPQAAMILMDPYTGYVLGMAGGRGEKTGNRVLNRATGAYRQPGSSIKPIAVYAPALENNLITPYTVLDDAPLRMSGDTAWPRNSNRRYKGMTTIISGVTSSTNTIAARTMDLLTPQASYEFMTQKLNVTSLNEKDIDYAPLSLGGLNKGMSVLEVTAAYCMFDNNGVYTKPRTFIRVEDANGNVVLDNVAQTTQAIREKNAWYMTKMLQSVVSSGTGSRAQLSNMPAAGKTGTTTTDKDRWFVGYTPYYCAGVWFGYDNPKPIKLDSSTNPALSLWKQVMERVHEELEPRDFFSIDDVVSRSYCLDSGLSPTDACSLDPRGSRVATGYFYVDDVPRGSCQAHQTLSCCGQSGELATPFCPAETLKQTALLDLKRNLPTGGITIEDDYYTIRYQFADGQSVLIDSGGNAPTALTNPDGTSPNRYCHLHPTAASALPSPDPSASPTPPPVTPSDNPTVSEPPVVSLPPDDDDPAIPA